MEFGIFLLKIFLNIGDDNAMDKASKAITNSEILSISKKIAMLEMKELNERQRAEHSQHMYEHLRNTLKQVEERNFELETKFAEVNLLWHVLEAYFWIFQNEWVIYHYGFDKFIMHNIANVVGFRSCDFAWTGHLFKKKSLFQTVVILCKTHDEQLYR